MIREATLDDVPALVAMGKRFRAAPAPGYASVVAENLGQIAVAATMLIEGDASVVLVHEDQEGVLGGMLGLMQFTHLFSGESTVGELAWWSEHPGIGLRLFFAGKQWALARGAVKMQMIQPDAEERLTAVYQRLGFQRLEVAWQIDLGGSN